MLKDSIRKSLLQFEIMVGDSPTLKYQMVEFIRNKMGLKVFAGQKRLVVYSEDERHVYKIAYNKTGLQDNLNEVLVSNKLKELANEGVISFQDLRLFALAEMVDNSSFIIKQERVDNFSTNEKFLKEFMNDSDENGRSEFIIEFVKNNSNLSENYNRILQILHKEMVPSDVCIFAEPLNYGLRETGELVLLDLGSIVPIVSGQRPICPKCGQHSLVYLPHYIKDDVSVDVRDTYVCVNKQCGLSTNSEIDIRLADYIVFRDYTIANYRNIMLYNVYSGKTFTPSIKCSNIQEFIYYLREFTRSEFSQDEIRRLWANYLIHSVSLELQMMGIDDSYTEHYLPSFDDYYNKYQHGIGQYRFNCSKHISDLMLSLLYIKLLGQQTGRYVDLVSAKSYNEFRQVMNQLPIKSSESAIQFLFSNMNCVYY